MSEWRPIETAPMDGSSVVLWTSTDNDDDRTYVRDLLDGRHVKEVQIGYFDEDRGEWSITYIGAPTHWMPLPEPPK